LAPKPWIRLFSSDTVLAAAEKVADSIVLR
jgi:hypothetical protein